MAGAGADHPAEAPVQVRLVAAVQGGDLDLVGLAVYGPRNAVDKVTKGAHMHR